MVGRIVLIFILSVSFQFAVQYFTKTEHGATTESQARFEGHQPYADENGMVGDFEDGIVDPENLGQRAEPVHVHYEKATAQSVQFAYCSG